VTRLDIEAPHNGLSHDVFLELWLRVVVNDPSAAVRTCLRQRNRYLFIDAIRNCTKSSLPVIGTALASWPIRLCLGFSFRKWRRLPFQRSQRFFKLLPQPFDLGLKSLVLFGEFLDDLCLAEFFWTHPPLT